MSVLFPCWLLPISIHALREEGDHRWTRYQCHRSISIHALREEGDSSQRRRFPRLTHFYPRPPRGGRRRSSTARSTRLSNFYPRPPRGGRPLQPCSPHGLDVDFYPRPPRGGRPLPTGQGGLLLNRISIHALREEGDCTMRLPITVIRVFLSTPSARRATT